MVVALMLVEVLGGLLGSVGVCVAGAAVDRVLFWLLAGALGSACAVGSAVGACSDIVVW